MDEDLDKVLELSAQAAKLLSHPARIQILKMLSQNNACVSSEFFTEIPLSRGSINQHLSALKEAEWIQTTLRDTQVKYCINQAVLTQGIQALNSTTTDLLNAKPSSCNDTPSLDRQKVLFLCTGNSCRSQMAEGFFNHMAKSIGWEASSAGTVPASEIHPLAISVMDEKEISLSGQRPKMIKEFLGKQKISLVIFVCSEAETNCPYLFPFAKRNIKMPFDDPAAFQGSESEKIEVFRNIRDQIEMKMKTLIQELTLGE